MDIKDVLQSLNIDLSDPEARQGAIEAIQAILDGRRGTSSGGGGENPFTSRAKRSSADSAEEPTDLGETSLELDPNLIQPPQRNTGSNDVKTDIEDEEDILSQIKSLSNNSPINNNDDSSDSNQSSSDSNNSDTSSSSKNKQDKDSNDSSSHNNDDNENSSGDDDSLKNDDSSDLDKNGSDNDSINNNNTKSSEQNKSSNNDDGLSGDGDPTNDEEEFDGDNDNDEDDDFDDEDDDFDDEDDNLTDDDFKALLTDENPKNKAQRVQLGRTIRAAKNVLSSIDTNSADGKELEKRSKILENTLDELDTDHSSTIDDKKFNKIISDVLDTISKIDNKSIKVKTQDEHKLQAEKIKTDMNDPTVLGELSDEEIDQVRKEKQAIIADKQKKIDRSAPRPHNSFSGFEDFIRSLKRAISTQVSTKITKSTSWSAINRKHDGTGVVMPGEKKKQLPDNKIPIIDFYFDCSGSWTNHDLDMGKKALDQLNQLENSGQIKINRFYFADNVYNNPDDPRIFDGATAAWNKIIDNIILTKATNVVIMTDFDMQRPQNNPNPKGTTVPGVVWFLWKDGENAPKLPQHLKGRRGTFQYSFNSY